MRFFWIFTIPILLGLACSKGTEVDQTNDTSDLHGVHFVAIDVNNNLKDVFYRDTTLGDGSDGMVYEEIGITADWYMYVVYSMNPWQALYMLKTGEVVSGELTWSDGYVDGYSTVEGDDYSVSEEIDNCSAQAWYLQSAFQGLPFHDEDWYFQFDMITPELEIYAYEAEFMGTHLVNICDQDFDCYKLDIDGQGMIGVFAPDVEVYYRVEEPHIPIRCWVQEKGIVFEYYSDSI